jgi:RNA polymerase sigma-70 factor (ECF subfamily)
MRQDFERLILPYLDAAYRLALWLVRVPSAAEDVVQDSYLRAYRAWGRYTDTNPKAWILTIVRRQALSWLKRERRNNGVELDADPALSHEDQLMLQYDQTQESHMIEAQSAAQIKQAIAKLSPLYGEIIMLKDIEGMAYKDIAAVLNIPMGTVMSRLSRARDALKILIVEGGAS